MPHSKCQQSCWLQEFCTKSEVFERPPQFDLGQTVDTHWFSLDRNEHIVDRGVVVGVYQAHDQDLPGWWYDIRFARLTHCDWLPMPHTYEVHESEIVAAEVGHE